ncbi:TPA: hypothetical protein ACF33U_004158 [Vibrio parahaemolyticus]
MVKRTVVGISKPKQTEATEVNQTETVTVEEKPFAYTLKDVPANVRTEFEQMKNAGKISGSMNAYFKRAILNQMRRDMKSEEI